jgi:hypothetical protein
MTATAILSPVKTCTKCKECKPATLEFFYAQPRMTCGFASTCKSCNSIRRRELLADRQAIGVTAIDKREDRASRRSTINSINQGLSCQGLKQCVCCSVVYPMNSEHFVNHKSKPGKLGNRCRPCQRAACQSHYGRNKETYHARARAFEKANPEWQSARNKKYRTENIQKIRNRLKNRRKTDHLYKTERLIRSSIADAFRRKGYTKRNRVAVILGCTWPEFQSHIERQFVRGMTWENRNAWEIDHIVPVATAKTELDVIALNHFTNLRPLWTAINRAKSDIITHLI